jgi:soluble lytic murein transglycosylase
VLEAARLLARAGDRTLAKRFFLHLAEGLATDDLASLADLALQIDEPHIALLIAKAAAERGVILPRAYYPVVDMVPDALPVSRALALAIARRESEFDPAAQSPAGARGLMQVMPGTAKIVSRDLGLDYALGRLTGDPAYNVTLGAQYLRDMADTFGPSVALIAAGYNAGPGRPKAWIDSFGDPRRADVDVVDWVETIPFAETRTYVMRVVEGVVIYRARLKGVAGPVRISAELKG